MTRPIPYIAALAALALAAPAQALTIQPGRITREDARYAAKTIYQDDAQAEGVRFAVAPCKPVGKLARACIVRVGKLRYRVVSWYVNVEGEITASSRRLS